MENYNPKQIEAKWQSFWEKNGTYKDYSKKEKFYVLDMFPYPSGAGLHVGHPKGYIATDVVARYMLLKGASVLHPMGWDAFGLPAENYAIKNKVHPSIAVTKNIEVFKNQLQAFGFTYDWDREIDTTDPKYYKWTQWIFLKMFEKGLAFESNEPVNWCPTCKTGLALEDLENGLCERCGSQVIKKKLRQWVLKMTAYADRLLEDLDSKELKWEQSIIEQQKNWIGRSYGSEFTLAIENSKEVINVYTTRLDTAFGITYVVLAPEHPLVEKLMDKVENKSEVEKYQIQAQNKTDLERTELQKEKTGVELKGVKAINPFTGNQVPVFVGDYVLGHYGTGAVMAVPAHDERDYEFAKKYNLPIIEVVEGVNEDGGAFTNDGILINSGEFDGLSSEEAREKMVGWLEKKGLGKKTVNYKMRDWVFSRQRYWGEPIPLIHCEKCGTVGVPEDQLPVTLPNVESYEPTGTGESPLANIDEWVNTTCPKCSGSAKRETNTMPQWAGSSWYYLRYIDPKNDNALVGKDAEKEWMPVDLYVGGAEHATRHLLYARFWHKFLYDIGVVSTIEPFTRLINVGLILAEDGRKMSKRWNNVVNPDDVIAEFGADAMRTYEMFMGPFTQSVNWSTQGVVGTRRFLDKAWKLRDKVKVDGIENGTTLHQTIKKVGDDIKDFRFNTAISAMMILVNELTEQDSVNQKEFESFLQILSPFAPHMTEELWESLSHKESIFKSTWPEYDEAKTVLKEIELPIQVNGKLRDTIKVSPDASESEVTEAAKNSPRVNEHTSGKEIVKIIYVKGRTLNIVVK